MAVPTGFEPAFSALTGPRVWPGYTTGPAAAKSTNGSEPGPRPSPSILSPEGEREFAYPIPIIPVGVSDNDHPTAGSPDELRRRFQILERVAIFFTLPDNILHALARRLAPASAARGSVIVHQGDPGDTMFIVESGRCEVYVEESPGHTITIALMGPDDFFGEMALISEETRTASVRALEDCRLLTLDRKTLYETVPAESDALIELTKLVEQRKDTLPNLIARARMVAPEQAASTVAIYSPKGGSGRTTIAVNLAASLARRFPGEVLLVDLALALTVIVRSVIDHSQRVLVLVTPELSSLKDVRALLNIFTNVLNIVTGRVILALNNKAPKSVVSKEDVVRTLKQELAIEIGFDGTKPDEAAVKGEILVLTDPKSEISRGVEQLAQQIAGSTASEPKGEKKGFKLGRR